MRRPKSEITWLDKDAYIGTEVTFPEKGSRWKLERKISDMRCLKQIHLFSEARAIYLLPQTLVARSRRSRHQDKNAV